MQPRRDGDRRQERGEQPAAAQQRATYASAGVRQTLARPAVSGRGGVHPPTLGQAERGRARSPQARGSQDEVLAAAGLASLLGLLSVLVSDFESDLVSDLAAGASVEVVVDRLSLR